VCIVRATEARISGREGDRERTPNEARAPAGPTDEKGNLPPASPRTARRTDEGTDIMLVLSRKAGERILIDGGIVVTVARIRNNQVRIAIEAPPRVGIYREEVLPGFTVKMPQGGEVSPI
jgi:carbon storage regulator